MHQFRNPVGLAGFAVLGNCVEVIAPSPKGDPGVSEISFFFPPFFSFFQIKHAAVLHLNDLDHDVSRKAPSIVSIVREKPDNSFIP